MAGNALERARRTCARAAYDLWISHPDALGRGTFSVRYTELHANADLGWRSVACFPPGSAWNPPSFSDCVTGLYLHRSSPDDPTRSFHRLYFPLRGYSLANPPDGRPADK